MINNVVLVGRLTRCPELKKTKNNKSVTSFTIALDKFGGDASFVPCVAWQQSAEYLAKYGDKGNVVAVVGELNTREYEGENGKVKVIEVIAHSVKLIGGKKKEDNFKIEDIKVDSEFKDEVFPWDV